MPPPSGFFFTASKQFTIRSWKFRVNWSGIIGKKVRRQSPTVFPWQRYCYMVLPQNQWFVAESSGSFFIEWWSNLNFIVQILKQNPKIDPCTWFQLDKKRESWNLGVWLKFSKGGHGWWHLQDPLRTTFAFTHPLFLRCFRERFLNDPHQPTSSIFHCYLLSPSTTPAPHKSFTKCYKIIHYRCRKHVMRSWLGIVVTSP